MSLKYLWKYIYGKSNTSGVNLGSNVYQHTETRFSLCKEQQKSGAQCTLV